MTSTHAILLVLGASLEFLASAHPSHYPSCKTPISRPIHASTSLSGTPPTHLSTHILLTACLLSSCGLAVQGFLLPLTPIPFISLKHALTIVRNHSYLSPVNSGTPCLLRQPLIHPSILLTHSLFQQTNHPLTRPHLSHPLIHPPARASVHPSTQKPCCQSTQLSTLRPLPPQQYNGQCRQSGSGLTVTSLSVAAVASNLRPFLA
ncbi:hypothetical protein E2C01_066192 [Portunus trituberculatus]|uniref:Uncharacterized protein n=1 Tax=Portunus trituberculatus TaxID=210409 RepID=A0A5B7HGF7_PORTR|nr:hypothetical protein [Portunus trituberculatus]